ncbi:nicotinamide riboside transporter PnuC [Enteractinococcus coprophilus]|uniref:Nicotinamide mononucleotide transporter n=1 Tax=Enteractinococcus coprophilus TaxID=1027633 RepID=A0A543AJ89_9MICC|nr:nicotinamide riboside transporter PnuC [Enteractinococcus coprophilus]TQL72586.1 nicotinamide mononucleotide transporter [Enteractinococcus coprophilus]
MQWLIDLFNWTIPIGGGGLLMREVFGNVFGLASALGGMQRKVWAWPVGIIGNVTLLTVFLSSIFGGADAANLLGQAGRQIMFITVSIYGWYQWQKSRGMQHGSGKSTAIVPTWASWPTRIALVVILVGGTLALTPLFRTLGSFEPVWADAWTFVGSLLATFGMAKGWVEFWLIWVVVDIVGVPLLFSAGYYATAFMYVFYGVFTLIGFFVWARARAREKPAVETLMPDPTLQEPGEHHVNS